MVDLRQRVVPLGWFYATARKNLPGWDEEYLRGMAFEDNDVMARLGMSTRVVIDLTTIGWHQSHPQQAYSDEWEGFRRNKKYTHEKWGGVPFLRDGKDPLDYKLTTVNAQMVLDISKRKEKVA